MLKIYSGWWNRQNKQVNTPPLQDDELDQLTQQTNEMYQQTMQQNQKDEAATGRLENIQYQPQTPQPDELSPETLKRLEELELEQQGNVK